MKRLFKRDLVLLTLIFLALASILFYGLASESLLNRILFDVRNAMADGERLRLEFLSSFGRLAPIIFVVLQVLQVVLAPLPGEASGILGGYLFGAWPGFVYSSIGLTLGSIAAFGIGHLFGDFVRDRYQDSRVYRRFNHLVSRGDFVIPFVLFLLPGFPKDALSYLLGLSSMPARVFLFLALVGRMPGTVMLSFQGAQVYQENFRQLLVLLVISLAISIPCLLYRRRILAHLTNYRNRS